MSGIAADPREKLAAIEPSRSEKVEHGLPLFQVERLLEHRIRQDLGVRLGIESKATAAEKIAASAMLAPLDRGELSRPGELALRDRLLHGVFATVPGLPTRRLAAPRGSLLAPGLVANARGESVLTHLASEFESADRVDLLCSFIELSGLDAFRRQIERHVGLGTSLRVLTTTYMRATELKAIQLLHRLGAEVRVSYDEGTTRLHAKAWLFHRESGYSTGYMGSSNLSHVSEPMAGSTSATSHDRTSATSASGTRSSSRSRCHFAASSSTWKAWT
jgi:hypothetical protein